MGATHPQLLSKRRSGVVVCNRNHESTFVVANRTDVLDITLASIGMAEAITTWRMDAVPSVSDHRTIRFTLMEVTVVSEVRRNIRRTDLGIFEQQCRTNINARQGHNRTNTELDQTAERITISVIDAWKQACPERAVSRAPGTKGWWCQALTRLRTRDRILNYGLPIGLQKESTRKDSLTQRRDHGVISAVALRPSLIPTDKPSFSKGLGGFRWALYSCLAVPTPPALKRHWTACYRPSVMIRPIISYASTAWCAG